MYKLTETGKAYLAGLLDGEGCIGVSKSKSKNKLHEYDYRLRVIITNSHYPTICWLKEITGIGCAYKYKKAHNPKWNVVHRWQVVAEQARDYLKAVRPYTIIKSDVIDLCMQLPRASKRGRSKEVYNEQVKIFDLAKKKNKRGATDTYVLDKEEQVSLN